MLDTSSLRDAAAFVAALLCAGCATVSPETRVALARPGQLSMLRGPPPMRAAPVAGDASNALESGDGARLALLAVTGLTLGGAASFLAALPPPQGAPVNVADVDGVSPSDLLSHQVQEELFARGYARPVFVPGVQVRFASRVDKLPASITAPTEYVLQAQVDSVGLDREGVPTALRGSLSLFHAGYAVFHSRCAPKALPGGDSAKEAWLSLTRQCAAELAAPLQAP